MINLPEILRYSRDVIWVLKGLCAQMTDKGWETIGIRRMDWINDTQGYGGIGTWFQKDGVTIYVAYAEKRYAKSGSNTRWELDNKAYAKVYVDMPTMS